MTTPELSPEAVEAQAPPIERFRKRPLEVEMMLWDGTDERLRALQAWTVNSPKPPSPDDKGPVVVRDYTGCTELWVAHSGSWVHLPVGTRVAREADGNGFYPISPMAIAGTFDPAPEPLELTPEERAAKEKSEHMSTCHEEACVDCMKELRFIRRIVKAIRPVIEEQALERAATGPAPRHAAPDDGIGDDGAPVAEGSEHEGAQQ